MPTGRMTAEHKRPTQARELARCNPHLLDNVSHADIGTKIVTWNGNTDTIRVQAAREMTEIRAVERLPVAAVNKDDNWLVSFAGKKIDPVSCPGPVANFAQAMPLAISRRIPCPTRHDRGIFGYSRPVVVFDFVIDLRGQDL